MRRRALENLSLESYAKSTRYNGCSTDLDLLELIFKRCNKWEKKMLLMQVRKLIKGKSVENNE